jgi:hypothetical protein
MEVEEWENTEKCASCSSVITRGVDRAYEFSDEEALCFECAVQRGGEYDPDTDTWPIPPNLSDLPVPRVIHP